MLNAYSSCADEALSHWPTRMSSTLPGIRISQTALSGNPATAVVVFPSVLIFTQRSPSLSVLLVNSHHPFRASSIAVMPRFGLAANLKFPSSECARTLACTDLAAWLHDRTLAKAPLIHCARLDDKALSLTWVADDEGLMREVVDQHKVRRVLVSTNDRGLFVGG